MHTIMDGQSEKLSEHIEQMELGVIDIYLMFGHFWCCYGVTMTS